MATPLAPAEQVDSTWRSKYDAALERVRALERQVQTASTELAVTTANAANASELNQQLQTELVDADRTLAQTTESLAKATAARATDAATIADQASRLEELTDRVRSQSDVLERERQLLVAGRDIRNLMGARNLHVIDVYDVDGRGRTRQSFGRAFYTEGKSLIFYAFDLGGTTMGRDKAFQAWGYREVGDRSAAAHSLGIFYVDDKTQNRWVLKVENPEILAQIDSVFVTIEPAGGSLKPSGRKLLYAYLNHQANHP